MIVRHAAVATRAISLERPLATSALQLASRHTRSRPPVRVTRRPTASTSPTEAPAPLTAAEEPTGEQSLTPALPLVSRLPVHVPHDSAGVLDSSQGEWLDSLRTLLSVPALVVARQLEMMSILIGYEQANRYQLLSPEGEVLGYLLEEELGIGSAIKRQVLRTHRPFKATVLDKEGRVLLIVSRGLSFGARFPSRLPFFSPPRSADPSRGSTLGSTSAHLSTSALQLPPPAPPRLLSYPPSPSLPLKSKRTRSSARRNRFGTSTSDSMSTLSRGRARWCSLARRTRGS